MPVRLRVSIGRQRSPEAAAAALDPQATVRVCGGTPELGHWDPKRSPKLQRVEADNGSSVWDGCLDDAVAAPGTEYKYVVLNESKHQYIWETQGPLHRVPHPGAAVATHEFNNASVTSAPAPAPAARSAKPAAAAAAGGERLVQKHVVLDLSGTLCPTSAAVVVVAVCGESPELGQWNVQAAPRLRQVSCDKTSGDRRLEGDIRARQGAEFKYVLLPAAGSGSGARWEESRANRRFGAEPQEAAKAAHRFDERERWEGGGAAGSGGHGGPAEVPIKATSELKVDGTGTSEDCWIPWGPATPDAEVPGPRSAGGGAPRSVFHAFHWRFSLVSKKLAELKELGFDAVQISPAQRSKSGDEWWTRYQPQDYTKIEGLGSADDLRQLCARAKELEMTIIADVVFNHMIVVASSHEWERAQGNPRELQALKKRLSQAVGPSLDAEDFQWPWFKMHGPHWDNKNRYEGWGNGEWSELRHCPKVVDVHKRHLRDLLDAGVGGIRFDAVKHMRPAHIAEYLQFLRESGCGFAYGEVLSVDEVMQKEYMELHMPTTDFALTVYMNAVLNPTSGTKAAAAGVRAAALRAASAEGLNVANPQGSGSSGANGGGSGGSSDHGSGSAALSAPAPPALASDSVRFARNHDTVMNPGSFYGLDASCSQARVVWAWLLAVHDGTVLMYPEDLTHGTSGDLLKRALKFRSQAGISAASSEVCLRSLAAPAAKPSGGGGGPAPALLTVTLRSHEGGVEGICLVNLRRDVNLQVSNLPVRGGSIDEDGVALVTGESKVVFLRADGSLQDAAGAPQSVLVPAWDAVFLVEAPF